MNKLIILTLVSFALATGSYQKIDVDEHLLQASNDNAFMLARSAAEFEAPEEFEYKKVESIHVQIVAGENIKYHISFSNGQVDLVYEVIIFSQPWTNTLEVSSITLLTKREELL